MTGSMSDPVFKTLEKSIKMLADWKCGVKVMRGPSLFPGRRSSLIYALISSSINYLWSSIIMLFGTDESMESQPSSSLQGSQPCRHFEFPEIQLATENFDESLVIGKGGFGKVYKGNVIYGSSLVVAAIKRLDSMSSQGADEFWAEVETLSMLRHCNLVSLIGYCNHGKEMILVYEYLPNGTLDDHLHKLGTSLSWVQRLKICIGSGQGLHYLHTGTGIDSGVIHRDVKSSNILLHESWAAKISDFGLSRIGPTNQPSTYVNTHVKGTFGYLDPNYFATGRLTRKSDVYAFGVVLMEVLCRKRAVDRSLDCGLATWAQDSIKEGDLKNIIDSGIKGEISPKCLKEFVGIAERCLHSHPKQRPTMAEVVVSLESILTLQEKINSSSQAAGKTIFGRMLMFPFTSLAENSAHGDSKLSSNNKGNSKTDRNTAGADNKIFLGEKEHPADYRNQSLKEFKLSDLREATRDFSPKLLLGEGRFGKVFLGWVDQNTFAPSKRDVGIAVAVKRRRHDSIQGHSEWQTEVSVLGRLANPNIISLLGYCSFEHEDLLVYEYMPNKSFDRFLFTNAPHNAKPLSWETRHKILIGVARGLNYLHSSKVQVIFRDLKCANILLDEDFNAKLGDFKDAKSAPDIGETHVSTRVMGTFGYLDPEYYMTGHLSVKTDIYCFGVVLLETLTGLRVVDLYRLAEPLNLVEWACPFLGRREKLKKIMDPRLEQNDPLEGAFECAKLALRCLAKQPKDRPSSEEVLQSLEQLYASSIYPICCYTHKQFK